MTKSRIQQWRDELREGDWVIEQERGLSEVLLVLGDQVLCQYKIEKAWEQYWTEKEKLAPPHKVRYVRTAPIEKRRKPRRKKRGRKKLKVYDKRTDIPIYFQPEKPTRELAQFPCVIVNEVSFAPFLNRKEEGQYEYLFTYLKSPYAQPAQAGSLIDAQTKEEATRQAILSAGRFIGSLLRKK